MTHGNARLLGVILSGGRSQRMGCDKALITIDNKTLLEHVYQRLFVQFQQRQKTPADYEEIIISTNNPLLLARDDRTYLADKNDLECFGPLSGIYSALTYAQAHHYQAIITVAVDTPFFPQDYVEKLHNFYKATTQKPILSTYRHALQPTFGLWPIDLIIPLKSHLQAGKRSIYSFAQSTNAEQYDFSNGEENHKSPFFNVNTPEDLQLAKTFWF